MISGSDILAARLAVGEGQTAFAKRLDVSQPTLSRLETGKMKLRGPTKLLVERVLADLKREIAA